jgi:hypothetical protein
MPRGCFKWSLEQADREGKRCFVDGSSVGHGPNKRYGFEDIGEMKIDLDEYDNKVDSGVQRWFAMVREPKNILKTARPRYSNGEGHRSIAFLDRETRNLHAMFFSRV